MSDFASASAGVVIAAPASNESSCASSSSTGGVYAVGISFVAFNAISYIAPLLFPLLGFFNKLSDKKKHLWNNTFVSFAHALFCAIFSTLCFYQHPEVFEDMIYADCTLCKCVLAASLGYFIYDSIDMLAKKLFLDSYTIWLHHAVVITCFSVAIYEGKFAGYLNATLIVEVNGTFLHLRKLMLTSGVVRKEKSALFWLNEFFLLSTMVVFRLGFHMWLLYKVAVQYSTFPNWFTFVGAFLGMVAMNALNFTLVKNIVEADLLPSKASVEKDE